LHVKSLFSNYLGSKAYDGQKWIDIDELHWTRRQDHIMKCLLVLSKQVCSQKDLLSWNITVCILHLQL
jgi:hypothetical protein